MRSFVFVCCEPEQTLQQSNCWELRHAMAVMLRHSGRSDIKQVMGQFIHEAILGWISVLLLFSHFDLSTHIEFVY